MPASLMEFEQQEPASASEAALDAAGLRSVADLELRASGNGLLERVLVPPGRGLVVSEALAQAPALRDLALETAAADGVALLLSAGAAWTLDTAEVLTEAAVIRWPALRPRHDVLRLALHEALVNAAMHGCFRVSPDLRDHQDGWLAHTAAIEEALRDPVRSLRPLLICAARNVDGDGWILRVADDGPGFDVAAARCAAGDDAREDRAAEAPRGRGLRLMCAAADTIAWEDGGRRVRMTILATPGCVGGAAEGLNGRPQ